MIMAGGGGTRLWPMSTSERPKPVVPHLGPDGQTLLAATIRRTQGVVDETWVVTTEDLASVLLAHTPELDPEHVIIEPVGRNTAPALALATLRLRAARGEEVTMLALPADHRVADEEGFRARVRFACDLAEMRDTVVTLGITPTNPATGYGYLQLDADADPIVLGSGTAELSAYPVARFVEKPDRATAETFVRDGHYLWNAGIFAAPLTRWVRDFERTSPEIWTPLAEAADPEALLAAYAAVPKRPVDVAVMERLGDIIAVPAPVGWSDLGTWDAVHDALSETPEQNVYVDSRLAAVDAGANLVITEGMTVGLLGVDGLVVVQRGDQLLVTTQTRAAELRALVDAVHAMDVPEG
jgi:mannose-1-phosphate guanylyltransferase